MWGVVKGKEERDRKRRVRKRSEKKAKRRGGDATFL